MAMMLATNVQLVADVLRGDEHSAGQVMRAIAATRSLDQIVEDTLRALVEQARAAGLRNCLLAGSWPHSCCSLSPT
jgi:hypothetical protein